MIEMIRQFQGFFVIGWFALLCICIPLISYIYDHLKRDFKGSFGIAATLVGIWIVGGVVIGSL